jgi:kynurenine formamidase
MTGTYIDFPGHIAEFDDGADAANYPIERLFMVETTFIRLDRAGKGREITAEELDAAGVEVRGDGLFIHARGETPWFESPKDIPYYGPSAIDWIVARKIHLFLSDVYEKRPDQQGIFVELFRRRIACVCCMVNLSRVSQRYVKVCAIPLPAAGVKQVPCRLLVVE